MTIASDTGPLIALAKIDLLSLLEQLFERVLLPPTVHRELLAKIGPESKRLDLALSRFLLVSQPSIIPQEVELAMLNLGAGEREALALAHTQGLLLLIDDRAGRQAARRFGVGVVGTVGVLLQAKTAFLIPLVRPLLEEIRANGYWLSDDLIAQATQLAGE